MSQSLQGVNFLPNSKNSDTQMWPGVTQVLDDLLTS